MTRKTIKQYGIDVEATGRKIGQLIEKRGLEVKELSGLLGLSPQAVYKWQNGKTLPDIENLYIFSRILGVKIDDFIVGTDKEEKNSAAPVPNRLWAYYTHIRSLFRRNA